MNVTSLRDLYIAEPREIRSVEEQLFGALPRMADVAGHPELKQEIQTHLEETCSQQARLEEILRRHNADPREHVDQAMQAMLQEAEKWVSMVEDRDLHEPASSPRHRGSSTTKSRCMARLPPGLSSSGWTRMCRR